MIAAGSHNHANAMLDQANWKSDANIYGFLARLWVAEIDAKVIEHLRDGELAGAYVELGGTIPEYASIEEAVDELAIEFCSCFLGPKGHLPPHQSVVSHSRFQGDCMETLRKFVEIIGQPEGELFQEQKMLDHAGIQLALMQRVCGAGADCDPDDLSPISELRARFADLHLKWLISYCGVAINKTDSTFYRGLFQVTADFLRSETA